MFIIKERKRQTIRLTLKYTPLIKAALNLRVGAGFDVYEIQCVCTVISEDETVDIFGMYGKEKYGRIQKNE